MNTSALKSFAPAVRTQLLEAVTRKLDYVLSADTPDLRQAAAQVAALRKEAAKDRKDLVERVAYTWFNRLAALRFVDARGWHPFKARVLTAATAEETQPELLKLVRSGSLPEELRPHTDLQRLNDLLDGRLPTAIKGADPQGEVYRHLVLAACRCYHALLPNLFEAINDETELLLPDDLLTATSVAEGFRTEITDEDCAEVEILGWLYQFYISERKDQVMARKSAVPTEDIPAVTQLFTPHWIVRYLVENSLGRLWLLNRPGSRLREHMPYYIEGENTAPGGAPAETDFLKITKPEDIKLIDPACGSAHMLTYAFDLLFLIYEEEGYAPSEIPALILRHNLHGLEICPRAAQLAELALVFKAREKSRRFFQPEHLVRPRIIELRDVRFAENELRDYIHALGLGDLFHQPVLRLLHQFEEAKNFGSLIQPCLDERAIADLRRAIEAKDLGGQLFLRETHLKVLRVLEQAEALTQRYHVVVANPPYLGGRQFNSVLKVFAQDKFEESKSDLFSMFIDRGFNQVIPRGHVAMVTMESWMFLSSFEAFRDKLLKNTAIQSLVHMPYLGRGGTSMGINFGTVATVWLNCSRPALVGNFQWIRYFECDDFGVPKSFPTINERHVSQTANAFRDIPGKTIAYWISPTTRAAFAKLDTFGTFGETRLGMATADNDRFLRRWHEVGRTRLSVSSKTRADAEQSKCRWFPYAKGGDYRKWYGNLEFVVDWERDGERVRNFTDGNGKVRSHNYNLDFIFKAGVTWSALTSSETSMRVIDCALFDNAGSSCFPPLELRDASLGFLNSKLLKHFIAFISPTFNYQPGDIGKIPSRKQLLSSRESKDISVGCVSLARADWDNFETSWDFREQPLLRPGLKGATLEASWRNWEAQSTAAIRRMQELETENNRLFIAAYGLDGELQPEVPEAQITLARAEARRDMAAFLSYAVGCMMGRYSLDRPGLVLADAGGTVEDYWRIVRNDETRMTNEESQRSEDEASPQDSSFAIPHSSFHPDTDGIIPVLDGEWFEDDIVARTRDFLRATFGEAALNENLRFLEASLGKPLEKYFLTDFYKDHLQTYKKRPIYWLFQSPRKGFSALVYLHRYTRDTVNTLLNKYLRDYLHKLEARIAHLTHVEDTATKPTEKTAARKERENHQKALKDCQAWERDTLLPLAQARIELDLDDGVKTNYLKFQGAVQPIPGLAKKED